MIPKPAVITGLLLAVSVLAFVGLAYPALPVSTTRTIIQNSTMILDSIRFSQYITAASVPTTETFVGMGNCEIVYDQYNNPLYCTVIAGPEFTFTTTNFTLESYAEQHTVTVPYSYTATNSITESSTNLVPASTLLGLTDRVFSALAILVIGILFILTAWIALKPRMAGNREQATLSHFEQVQIKSSPEAKSLAEIQVIKCSHCEAEVPRGRVICPKCGLPVRSL